MKKLEKYYKNGYDFTLVHREGDLAIALGKSRLHGGDNWEVIEVQSHNGVQMGANWVEACEFPPRNEQFGIKGWSGVDEKDAWRIFNKQKNGQHVTNTSI